MDAPNEPESKLSKFWREWAKPVLVVVLVVSSFRSTFADWNDVPSGSMKPTILEGDRVFLNKMAYDVRMPFVGWRLFQISDPKRGDIVIFPSPRDGVRLIKRLVGIPGDTIEMRDHKLLVNGKVLQCEPLDPSTLTDVGREVTAGKDLLEEDLVGRTHAVMYQRDWRFIGSYGPRKLEADEYFAMGDNRDDSADSRVFGPVRRETILGKALAVALSVDPEQHYLPRFKRFFTALR